MLRVALIDDEISTLRLLPRAIDWAALGLEICGTASDGVEGLELLRRCAPDIVIVDIKMPRMDGLAFSNAARQARHRAKTILLSAHADFDFARRAIPLRISDYLLKPLDEAKLRASLLRVRHEIEQERRAGAAVGDGSSATLANDPGNAAVRRAMEYVSAHYADHQLSLHEVANEVGISKNYFSQLFHTIVGVRFWDYLTRVRIDAARELLSTTTASNYEISRRIGYESEYHFSRKFKDVVGVSPRHYQKGSRKPGSPSDSDESES